MKGISVWRCVFLLCFFSANNSEEDTQPSLRYWTLKDHTVAPIPCLFKKCGFYQMFLGKFPHNIFDSDWCKTFGLSCSLFLFFLKIRLLLFFLTIRSLLDTSWACGIDWCCVHAHSGQTRPLVDIGGTFYASG